MGWPPWCSLDFEKTVLLQSIVFLAPSYVVVNKYIHRLLEILTPRFSNHLTVLIPMTPPSHHCLQSRLTTPPTLLLQHCYYGAGWSYPRICLNVVIDGHSSYRK